MKRITSLLVCMLLFGFYALYGQNIQIKGTVTSAEDGSTLPGVTVSAKGTNIGVLTDADGRYTISVPSGTENLEFKFMGLIDQSVAIAGMQIVDVVMELETYKLDEIVVTALGISREKKSLSYSVQDVSGDEFAKAKEKNLINSLAGKVAGVDITNSSGSVGSSSRITLRGASSITGSNEPLFVVDGIPIDNTNYGNASSVGGFDLPGGIADINSNDIQNVSVLKGPNAAALYGLRAANGVIVITTKRGKIDQAPVISFNSSTTFEKPLVLPDFQNSYGQGPNKDFFEWINGNTDDGGVDESWGPPLDIGLEFTQWNSYTNNGKPLPWVSQPDNVKNFYETGITTDNNLSFSGGSKNLTYRLSVGMMKQKGIIPNTDFSRYNVSGNSTLSITEKLKAGFNFAYTKSLSGNIPTGGYAEDNPVMQMIWSGRNVDFEALKDWRNLPLAPAGTPIEGSPINWNTQFHNNIYWMLDNDLNKLNKDNILGTVNLSYDITKDLVVNVKTSIDKWSSVISEQFAQGNYDYPFGYYRETDRSYMELNSEVLASYKKEITDNFKISLNIGGNAMSRQYSRIIGTAPQLELPGVYNLSNVKSGVNVTLTNRLEESKINSIYGFGQISFKDAIFLDFSGRNDWASVLPTNNNSFFYPAISLSAVLTDFMNIDESILTFFKIRGGWSKVGSIGALDPYRLQQPFQFETTPWGSVLLPYNPASLNNPNLFSETAIGKELGFEARFLNNRIGIDFTYFNQKNKDLIIPVEISAASGYVTAWDNVGVMTNKGVEIQLKTTPVKSGDFKVDVNFNFHKTNNRVESLGGLETLILGGQWNVNLEARVNQPYGVLFGPGYVRDDAGNIVHKDGLPLVATDYKILGDIQPDWRGGVSLEVEYKGISLSTLIDGKFGGDVYSMTTTWGRYSGVLNETLAGRETGIVGKGVKNIGTDAAPEYVPNDVVVSAKSYNQTAFDNSVAEGSVFDASYVKLRQVVVSYNVPSKLLNKTFVKGVTVSFVGRTLALLYKNAPHIDPETGFSSDNSQQGQEFGQLPSTRSLGFTLNLTF
jgi:TonB-linked SusC/RagA family outer membrane protein